MKKRVFLVVMTTVVVLLIASVTTGATMYYDEDFSDPSFMVDKAKIIYTAESNPPAGEESIVEIVAEDSDITGDGIPDGIAGTLHVKNTVISSDLNNSSFQLNFPDEFRENAGESIFMYDLMLPDVSTYNTKEIVAMMYYGGFRHNAYFKPNMLISSGGNIPTGGHEPGQWYTYMYHLSSDKAVITAYRKLQSEPDSSFERLGECNTGVNNSGPYFYLYTYNGRKSDLYFDNIKLYTGTNILEHTFTLNGNEVEEISELTEGELEANISFLSNKEKTELNKLMVAYDKNYKLLGCTVVKKKSENFIFGHNEITAKMSLDAESAGALADGGYVGLYIWDGLNPVMVPVELY